MAIIRAGNFGEIGVRIAGRARAGRVGKKTPPLRLPKSMSLSALEQINPEVDVKGLELVRSKEPWALYLKHLTLNRSFEGFLSGLFNRTNEIYFVSFAWDYSGRKPKVFPYTTLDPAEFLLKMKKGQSRDFMGDGVALWPARRVSGALNVIIMVYESDADVRRSGEVLDTIHTAVDKSSLTEWIRLIADDPAIATARAISGAVKDLVESVGKIMKKNKNDVVELFEGSYGTHLVQVPRVENYHTEAAGVEVEFTVGG